MLASVVSFPHDLEVVRQAALLRAELIGGERAAGHLRVVQASFAAVITEFVRSRNADVPGIDLKAEVAGAALAAALVVAVENWGRGGCTGDLGQIVADSVNLVRSGLAPCTDMDDDGPRRLYGESMAAAGSCRACGLELREGARFCDGCGAPAGAESEPAEYKQVTILFADVVRSMDIAARVGPERLREIMTDLVSRSAEVIERSGGRLNSYTGDGLMALFGAPAALEDHAFRACLAALDIQRAAEALAAEVMRRDGVTLRLRIGINSGQVITGEIRSSPASYTAVGDQVGMAQRMESVAPRGRRDAE